MTRLSDEALDELLARLGPKRSDADEHGWRDAGPDPCNEPAVQAPLGLGEARALVEEVKETRAHFHRLVANELAIQLKSADEEIHRLEAIESAAQELVEAAKPDVAENAVEAYSRYTKALAGLRAALKSKR